MLDLTKLEGALRPIYNILPGWAKRLVQGIYFTAKSWSHRKWIKQRLAAREKFYPAQNEPGLFSVLTTAWNTPVKYLHILAESLFAQAKLQDFEWVLLDNGTTNPDTRRYLEDLARRHPEVKFFRVEENLGIIGGMRLCLEQATGRYIVPVDSDDYLYPDSLSIIAWYIRKHNYPKALYSDEDKLKDNRPLSPYFKPDWDPVLFTDSCYIAHLCSFDRQRALELLVYSSNDANGSHDWDTYFRFWLSGEDPVHVPEILYSWRMHEASAAQNIDSKSYIFDSQHAVLQRYIDSLEHPERFQLLPSQVCSIHTHAVMSWVRRKHIEGAPLTVILVKEFNKELAPVLLQDVYPKSQIIKVPMDRGLCGLRDAVRQLDSKEGMIAVVSDRLLIESYDWPWEALGIFERFHDTAMVGGLIYGYDGKVLDGGIHFGFSEGFGCPERGSIFANAGYFAKLWVCQSVSCVNTMFCVFDGKFLASILEAGDWMRDSLLLMGPWAAVHARRAGRRVVFCPTLRAKTFLNWLDLLSPEDKSRFMEMNPDCFPDHRYYHQLLSEQAARAFIAGSTQMPIVFKDDNIAH